MEPKKLAEVFLVAGDFDRFLDDAVAVDDDDDDRDDAAGGG